MFKTVSLPAEMWVKIVRRLTAEVGADDASRMWAGAIQEQTSGAVKVRSTGSSNQSKEHNMTPAEHVKAIEDAAMAYASTASECARRGLVTPYQCWKSLKAAIIAGVGAAPPKDSAEFALAALVAAGYVSQSKVDEARALMPEGGDVTQAPPEGWQLVPVAPTHAMLAAAAITRPEYRSLLEAAPKP